MGPENRVWLLDNPWDDQVLWSYKDEYLGGSLSYEVDVSNVPCNCAFGMFLAFVTDEGECSWGERTDSLEPQCDTISLMEANNAGFLSSSRECSSGSCTDESQCMGGLFPHTGYGPTENHTINTK